MSIRDELELFDGRHTAVLESIISRHRRTNSFIEGLVLLVPDNEPKIQMAATWLLKRLAENQVEFKTDYLIALFASLAELKHWTPRLHVCQMLKYVTIPDESKRNVAWFLEQNLLDENRFLRAWSYSGFYELARQHAEYIDCAIDQLEHAETEKAASVKARIRNIRKAASKLRTSD